MPLLQWRLNLGPRDYVYATSGIIVINGQANVSAFYIYPPYTGSGQITIGGTSGSSQLLRIVGGTVSLSGTVGIPIITTQEPYWSDKHHISRPGLCGIISHVGITRDISKDAFLNMNNLPLLANLDTDKWDILEFNKDTREACIRLENDFTGSVLLVSRGNSIDSVLGRTISSEPEPESDEITALSLPFQETHTSPLIKPPVKPSFTPKLNNIPNYISGLNSDQWKMLNFDKSSRELDVKLNKTFVSVKVPYKEEDGVKGDSTTVIPKQDSPTRIFKPVFKPNISNVPFLSKLDNWEIVDMNRSTGEASVNLCKNGRTSQVVVKVGREKSRSETPLVVQSSERKVPKQKKFSLSQSSVLKLIPDNSFIKQRLLQSDSWSVVSVNRSSREADIKINNILINVKLGN